MVNTVCPDCGNEFETSTALKRQIKNLLADDSKTFTQLKNSISSSETTIWKYLEKWTKQKKS